MSDTVFLVLFYVFAVAFVTVYGWGLHVLHRKRFSISASEESSKVFARRLDLAARWGIVSFVSFAFMRIPGGWLTVVMGVGWVGFFVTGGWIGLQAVLDLPDAWSATKATA